MINTRGSTPHASARTGVIYGVAAYVLWGLVPIYFKAVKDVSVLEVLAHRIVWSTVFLVLLTLLWQSWRTAFAAMRSRRTVLTLCLTALLIAGNWYGFIWAVEHEIVMQASLGYFINPLVNVLLGFVFLREHLRRWQTLSVILAGVGVVFLTIEGGRFPSLALFLAFSFGFYALLRKTAPVDPLSGLTIETLILTPPAVAFLAYEMVQGQAAFGAVSLRLNFTLMAAGLVTAIPLLWFAAAARRLRLATLGFIQYVTPTGHFLLALAYGEEFARAHLVAFVCIWIALVIYSIDTALHSRPTLRPTSL